MGKVLAVLALLALAIFLFILVKWVPEPDLMIVCAIVVAMAAYDFYRSEFSGRGPR